MHSKCTHHIICTPQTLVPIENSTWTNANNSTWSNADKNLENVSRNLCMTYKSRIDTIGHSLVLCHPTKANSPYISTVNEQF